MSQRPTARLQLLVVCLGVFTVTAAFTNLLDALENDRAWVVKAGVVVGFLPWVVVQYRRLAARLAELERVAGEVRLREAAAGAEQTAG